jgi:hypothetical protein
MNAVPNDWTSRLAKALLRHCMSLNCGIGRTTPSPCSTSAAILGTDAGVVLADCPKLNSAKGKSFADCVRSVWIRELLAEIIAG